MRFSREDLLRRALEKNPNPQSHFTPIKPGFRKAVEAAYFEEFETERENIPPDIYAKLDQDVLSPFCVRVKTLYNHKSTAYKIDRMMSNHKLYFATTVPDFASFLPQEQPQTAPLNVNAAGENNPKKPLGKSRVYEVYGC